MKNKLIIYSLIVCLCAGFLAACGAEDMSSSSDITSDIEISNVVEMSNDAETTSVNETLDSSISESEMQMHNDAVAKSDSQPSTTAAGGTQKLQTTAPPVVVKKVSYTIDDDRGNVFYSGSFEFSGTKSVYDLLRKTGITYMGDSNYVSSLAGMAEKEHGPMSGWMYTVNGTLPMVSCGAYNLSDGDTVRWYYFYDE